MTDRALTAQTLGVMEGALALELPAAVAAPDLRTIYESEFAYVWRTLRRLGLSGRDIEDGVQDVFVVVHRHLGDYDPARPLRPWLFGIAYRVVLRGRRRTGTQAERLTATVEAAAEILSADQEIEAREQQAMVQEALLAMGPERRAVLVMHDIDGHAAPEIADALDVPTNTVYSRLRLARRDFALAIRRLQARRAA